MRTVALSSVKTARDLRLFLAAVRPIANEAPVLLGDREVMQVELQEGDHPTLGKVLNIVLTLGDRS